MKILAPYYCVFRDLPEPLGELTVGSSNSCVRRPIWEIGKGAASLCLLTHNVLLLSVALPGSSDLLGLAGREHPGVSGTLYNSLPLSKFTHSRALN